MPLQALWRRKFPLFMYFDLGCLWLHLNLSKQPSIILNIKNDEARVGAQALDPLVDTKVEIVICVDMSPSWDSPALRCKW